MIAHTVDELNRIWAGIVSPFVKPILEADSKGRPSPNASSVLVSVSGRQSLITAHHVTRPPEAGTEAGMLYTYLPEQTEILGTAYFIDDPYDLSTIAIPQGNRQCLQLPDHLAFDVRPGEICLVFGFQARSKCWDFDLNQNTFRPTPLAYLGTVLKTSDAHFTLRLNFENTSRGGRRISNVGKLNGISGGGAFVLRRDAPRLAGIVIEYHRNRAELVCTNSLVAWRLASQVGREQGLQPAP
jgi:hypothetical protein